MRVFHKAGSDIVEISKQVGRYNTAPYEISYTAGDFIYLAVDFPMNHFWVKIGDVNNDISAEMSVHYWSNNEWVEVVDLNDETVAFASSGFVSFTPNRDEPWEKESSNYSGESVDGLEDIVVYDKFWVRISFDQTLTSDVELKFIGSVFSSDDDLYSEYPIFNDSNFKTAFASGKTNWEEQHCVASELIIQDLKRKNVILGKEQILERSILVPASVSKVAELLFNAFGRDYNDSREAAKNNYDKRIDLSQYIIDKNSDGIPDPKEITHRQGWLSR
jgi:hypothetical protein